MKHRKLRIAWSVAWGVVAMLLCVLWVRSRYTFDFVNVPLPGTSGLYVMSREGGLGFLVGQVRDVWSIGTLPPPSPISSLPYKRALGFLQYLKTAGAIRVRAPHLLFLLLSAAAISAPWLRWRFSLRTLLIATTLVAVAMGLIVWLSK
jgi:hypothetical protein